MKRVLVIAFDFPPRRTSAVYRIAGLLKYLVRFGWEPTVLTVRAREGDIEDDTLQKKLPLDLRVVRTRYVNLAGWEDIAMHGIRAVTRPPPQATSASGAQASGTPSTLRSLAALVRSCLYFPDETSGWVPFAVAEAAQLHFERRFDVIYTTSPPRSAPVIGLLLKVIFRIPWVTEFRDPWYPPKRPLRKRAERWLQSVMLKRADTIVVHSKGYAEELQTSFAVPPQKLAVIRNGFDEEDFKEEFLPKSSILPAGFVHLSHFGTVYPNFSGNFFPALAQLLQEIPEIKHRLRVNIIGFPDEVVLRYADSPELREIIHVHGFIHHEEALQAMRASEGLLLFLGDTQISRLSGLGKIYEYLRVGRPILAVAPDGGTKELVLQADAGWVVSPDDSGAIKEALRQLLQQGTNGKEPHPKKPDFVAQFRYDRLAEKLGKVFDNVACHGL